MNPKILFKRLIDNRMPADAVKVCLKLSQSEFLNVLLFGARAHLEEEISRAYLAELAEVSSKSMYSYFASSEAKDFRRLTDEMRIAMMWRVTNNITSPAHRENKAHKKYYLYNNERVSLTQAARLLCFSHPNSLGAAFRRLGVKYGDEISHLDNPHPGVRGGKFFIVNGTLLNAMSAATELGFSGYQALYHHLKKHNLSEGDDISFLRRRKTHE